MSRQLRPLSGTSVITSEASPGSANEVGDNSLVEGVKHDTRKYTHAGTRTKQKRGHRKRRPRSMGRHPFLTMVNSYCEDMKAVLKQNTIQDRKSSLLRVGKALDEAKNRGDIATTNPMKLGKKEIDAITLWAKSRNYALTTQWALWTYLKLFLRYCGNSILDELKVKGQWRSPKPISKPIFVKDDEWLKSVIEKLSLRDDWQSKVVMISCILCYSTGVRSKELRLVSINDLDKKTWILTISHPKGEGRWATEGEKVGIFPSIREHVLDYLDFRESRLKELGIEQCEPLFPNELGNYYHPASFSKMRTRLFKKLGIDGNYKVLRPSFGQRLKNGGASIEAVSKALRHTTVATTERFYARIRTSEAWSELEQVWEKPKVSIVVD